VIERIDFVQEGYAPSADWTEVLEVADSLIKHLAEPTVRDRIVQANLSGTSSAAI
jgi:hypothetical protein